MVLASKILLAAFGVAVLAVVLSIFAAGQRWESNSRNLATRLEPRRSASARFDPGSLPEDLPEPVAQYLRRSLPAGTRPPATVQLSEEGTFRAGEERGWRGFTADHYAGIGAPGFVWDARIGMAPAIHVRVRDAYLEGVGSMEVKILSVVSVLNQRDRPELAAAALQRWLAEAVWYPWALIPGPGLGWSAIDSLTARATVTHGNRTVSLDFRFDVSGDVVSVSTPARHRWVDGTFETAPWKVRLSEHDVREGVRLPLRAEVAWGLPRGEFPYYRGAVTAVRFLSHRTP